MNKVLQGLMPALRLKGKNYVAVTPILAGIPRPALGSKVANCGEYRTDILAALDLLMTGV